MTNLVAVDELSEVPQLETSTLALGGPGAVMNAQAQALLNRQKHYVDALLAALDLKGSLDGNNTWTGPQRGAFVALTSTSASIAVDLNLANNFDHTLTEDTTLAAPTNAVAGQSGMFVFTNHASSPKTLALNAFWKMPGGAPASIVTAGNSAVDILSYVIAPSGAYAICSVGNDVS